MSKRIILYTTFSFFFLTGMFAQEQISGLQTNIEIYKAWHLIDKQKTSLIADTLSLPFFDDFSQTSPFPDSRKWSDKSVYINNTLSVQQITSGMATFDALDQTGRLYENATSAGFVADMLTSLPLNLNLPASDSIYLSFFYQPQGLADAPETNDSLSLQFYAPSDKKWVSVWSVKGTEVHDFRPVIICINKDRFLRKGFRFRFINHASLSSNVSDPAMTGNCDQWNIDYVRLDRNRTSADTIPHDVAFTLPVRSMLKTHEAMPWKQFKQVYLSEMGPWIGIHYRNNDNIVRNVTRNFEITDEYSKVVVHSFSSGATNITPLTNINYNAGLFYTFNSSSTDSALFKVTSILKTDDFDPKSNDTIVYYQRFGNYFAFDDGSAESGYGINGQGSRNAMVAYRFKSFIPDSLRAIQICFNDSYLNTNQRSFDLMVWSDNNGTPGDLLYSQEEEMVTPGATLNGYSTYVLTDPVKVSAVFYVGWKQRTETFLNAGLDVNTPHNGRQYYWINGNWSVSQVNGSLMIRPVTGKPFRTSGVNDLEASESGKLNIWPNPVRDFLTIEATEVGFTDNMSVTIYDLQGRIVKKEIYTEKIDVSALNPGIYLIMLYSDGKPLIINRFIKTY